MPAKKQIRVWAPHNHEMGCMLSPKLFARDRLELIIGKWTNRRVPHDKSRAGIPSENGIIIVRRAQDFGALVVLHCLPECVIGERGTARPASAKMSVRVSL